MAERIDTSAMRSMGSVGRMQLEHRVLTLCDALDAAYAHLKALEEALYGPENTFPSQENKQS